MASYYLSLPGGLTACLRTPFVLERDDRVRLRFGAYVPGMAYLDAAPKRVDFTVEHLPSRRPRLEVRGRRIALYAPEKDPFPEDLYHLFMGVARRELLRNHCYPVHSSCVGTKGRYVLLIGHSGMGKTTLAHRLVRTHGLQLYSGGKTVTRFASDGGLRAIAGTRTMTALDRTLNRYAYRMTPAEEAPFGEVRIVGIYLPKVNGGVKERRTLTPLSALHTLYSYFLDTVHTDVVVNGKEVFDGAPPSRVKQEVAQGLVRMTKRLPVMMISGLPAFLARVVLDTAKLP